MNELFKKQLANKLVVELKDTGVNSEQINSISSVLSLFAESLKEVGKEDFCTQILLELQNRSDLTEKLFIVSPIKISQKDGERIKNAFIKKYSKENKTLNLEFENIVNKKVCNSGLLLKYKDLEIDLSTENKIKLFLKLLNN